MPPMSCTSKGRRPRTRSEASRTSAKDSTRRESRSAPFATLAWSSLVLARSSSSESLDTAGPIALMASTRSWYLTLVFSPGLPFITPSAAFLSWSRKALHSRDAPRPERVGFTAALLPRRAVPRTARRAAMAGAAAAAWAMEAMTIPGACWARYLISVVLCAGLRGQAPFALGSYVEGGGVWTSLRLGYAYERAHVCRRLVSVPVRSSRSLSRSIIFRIVT